MIQELEKLTKEKDQLQERIDKINKVIDAYQDVCKHTNDDGSDAMLYEGNDSHKSYYKCTICGYTTWY